jgi:hypothetical protein
MVPFRLNFVPLGIIANRIGGFACTGGCDDTEILMAENDNYKVGSQEGACYLGTTAKYCCKKVSWQTSR